MLRDTLRAIHDVRGLAALFAELGYAPADEPARNGARTVARWRAFAVIGAEAADPVHAARALARGIALRGERGCAVAVGAGVVAIAAPRPCAGDAGRALTVDVTAPSPLAIRQLQDLAPRPRSTALAHALRVAEVLSSEAAGTRFFTAFRVILERMAASLPDERGNEADRRLVALLALTRVLFLYFVQAKGWLGGKPDYLRRALDDALARRRPFHETVLEPLFFGTLNLPPARRDRRHRAPGIPYLNGGLFEPHPVERRRGTVRFDDALWRDAFDALFERFRFCVRESAEVDAIAPDMLGRVFERLMDGDERHRSGSYYTPEKLVREVVAVGVRTGLEARGGIAPDVVARLVEGATLSATDRADAARALRRMRLLDPAVGSGAFLLGALESLTALRQRLRPDHPVWRHRRDVLAENLFGVDLNPVAVRLTELRLWLAVVADDPTEDVGSVEPLPNLDGVVRQGDTLIDPIGTARQLLSRWTPDIGTSAADARAAREQIFHARDGTKRSALERLRQSEFVLARSLLVEALSVTARATAELEALARTPNLFNEPTKLTTDQRAHIRRMRQNRAGLERALAALDGGALPFFSFDVHAPDVVARGGFDLIVGNPPWVRAERLAPHERRSLRQRFRWWRAGGEHGFRHQPDLSVAFLERSLELAAPGGTVAFLMPSKLATADYGAPARRQLVRETTLRYLHRIPDRDAAGFGATAYPLTVVAVNAPPPERHRIRLGLDARESVSQERLGESGPWILGSDELLDALHALSASGVPLGQIAYPALGAKTGADRVFVGVAEREGPQATVVRFGTETVEIESTLLRPALRGRDVLRFETRPRRVILWTSDDSGTPLRSLPPLAAAYLARHESGLRRRADYRRDPPWTLFRTAPACASHRVVWPDIARRPRAVALAEAGPANAIPLNTCYVFAAPDRETALLAAAVLNSTWVAALAGMYADEARGGYRRINAHVAARVPLPPAGPARADLANLANVAHHAPDHVSDEELDAAVAEALGLSERVQQRLRRCAADFR